MEPLAYPITILSCGHFVCGVCIDGLVRAVTKSYISCPACRDPSPIVELAYIAKDASGATVVVSNPSSSLSQVAPPRAVKGNWGTKIERILLLLLRLREEDAAQKTLVFSSWVALLKIISAALT